MAVWLLVTLGCAAVVRWLAADLAELSSSRTFDALLPQLAALAVAGCAVWFWWVTTWTTVGAARGLVRAAPGCPRPLQRAVLAACGLALAGGVSLSAPALADTEHGPQPAVGPAVLVGLPLPDRASGQEPHRPAPTRATAISAPAQVPATVVVRPGDTLWALAASALPDDATDAEITSAWQALYAANRDVISDPDLIYPGTALDLPAQPAQPASPTTQEDS